jgi:hypothetical protein
MIQYLRIPRNKFWGWVFTSLALGLILGTGAAYAVSRVSSAKQIDDLKKQLESQTAQAASSAASLQSRLDSADTSLTALSQQYTQLQQQNAADKAAAKSKSSASSTTTETVTLEVVSRTVSPSTVASGDLITLTAQVKGKPDSVNMRITSSANGVVLTYSLKKVSTSGSVQRWRRVVSAPKKKGTYRYYAIAHLGDKSATMPGASISTFKVE